MLPFRKLLAATAALLIVGFSASAPAAAAPPLHIGYSDWPGWVAWQVAIQKNWFKEAGVDVQFEWFDYSASLNAFSAGKLDGVGMTNGDSLVTGATGGKNTMYLVTDYSSGNDMIIAKPGINSIKDLKGKKIGVEIGLVDHLMVLYALKQNGMSEADVTLVNSPTNQLPQVLASGQVDAIAAWQPSSGTALKLLPGSKPIYTSRNAPGLIYDMYCVSPQSWATRRADWEKVMKVWYRVVNYIHNPKTQEDAVKIMSARVGLKPAEYLPLLEGTKLLTLKESKAAFKKGPGLDSIYGSSKMADDFNVANGVYKQHQDVDSYIDPTMTEGMK